MLEPIYIYIYILSSKNLSVVNTICIISFRYTNVITYRKLRLNRRDNWLYIHVWTYIYIYIYIYELSYTLLDFYLFHFSFFLVFLLLFISSSSIFIIIPLSFFLFSSFLAEIYVRSYFFCLIVRWITSTTCLGIVVEICFQYFASWSRFIDFCSFWNHREILIFWWFFEGILVVWIAQSQFSLVAEENVGDNLLHDYRYFGSFFYIVVYSLEIVRVLHSFSRNSVDDILHCFKFN